MGAHRRIGDHQGGNLSSASQNVAVYMSAQQIVDARAGSWNASSNATTPITAPEVTLSPHPTRKHALLTSGGTSIGLPSPGSPLSWLWDNGFSTFCVIESIGGNIGGSATTCAWGAHGWCHATGGTTTPFLRADLVFDAASTTTQLTTSANPAGQVNDAAWSPDNRFLAVAHNTTPFVAMYELDSGARTLTKISNPATLPGSTGNAVAWSPDGAFVAVGNITSTPFLRIYDMRNAAAPSTPGVACTLNAQPGSGVNDVVWTPDGSMLLVFTRASPRAIVYQRTADTTFTKSNATWDPANNANQNTAMHPNGRWAAAGWGTTSPFAGSGTRQDADFVDSGTLNTTPTGSTQLAIYDMSHHVAGAIISRKRGFRGW